MGIGSPILLAASATWLVPIWLVGLGCFIGLLVLAVLYGLSKLLFPRVAQVAEGTLRDGFVLPVLGLAAGFSGFALLSLLLSAAGVGYLPLSDLTRSLARLPKSNAFQKVFDVDAVPQVERGTKPQEFPLEFRPQEMRLGEHQVRSGFGILFARSDQLHGRSGPRKIHIKPQ